MVQIRFDASGFVARYLFAGHKVAYRDMFGPFTIRCRTAKGPRVRRVHIENGFGMPAEEVAAAMNAQREAWLLTGA